MTMKEYKSLYSPPQQKCNEAFIAHTIHKSKAKNS